MPEFYFLYSQEIILPPINSIKSSDDIVIVGGNLEVEWLFEAYQKGYFPWFSPQDPVMWWHPKIRAVMTPQDIRVHKSMRPYLNQVKFHLRIDYAFEYLMHKARETHLRREQATWITEDFIREYTKLHKMGYAHSFEAWKDNQLVGGLYGVSLGRMFFGEAMFSAEKNASKFCFIALAEILQYNGFNYIDCQVPNDHLSFMGCKQMDRKDFISILKQNKKYESIVGNWSKLLHIPSMLKKHFIS